MNPDENCTECKYFVQASPDEGTGECHRHAPRPGPHPKMQIEGKDLWADTQWPKVRAEAWCGEFEPKAS